MFRDCSGYKCWHYSTIIKGTIVSRLCDTTGQVFVPLESRRVPVELIVLHPCAWRNVAVISRADGVFTGIHSLGFGWNQVQKLTEEV